MLRLAFQSGDYRIFKVGGWLPHTPPRDKRDTTSHEVISCCYRLQMYLVPGQEPLSLLQLEADTLPQVDLPNITKGVTDVLELCETAGLDRNGVQCGLCVQ